MERQRVCLLRADGIKASDLKRIKSLVDENSDIIIRHWNKHFGKEVDDED